jgi:hypothetical protein
MYAAGRGVARDEVEAAKWYRLAADHGYVLALSTMSLKYLNGEGVPKDMVQALKWISLAVMRGDQRAKSERDLLAKSMTPAQVAEATKLAQEWKPTPRR